MTAQIIPKNTVQQAISVVLQNNNPSPPENNDYRYYHCHLDWNAINCKKVDGPHTISTRDDSILLFVKNYIPESLDKTLLKYKCIPTRVIIEEKST